MTYKTINIDTWPRRKHFEFFRQTTYPHYNLSVNADITNIIDYIKTNKLNVFRTLLYVACKIANDIPQFRQRIIESSSDIKVIEHDIVNPSFTYMSDRDNLFGYCTVEFKYDRAEFDKDAAEKLEINKSLHDMPKDNHRNDLLFITCIPWFSFTSFVHTFNLTPVDTIPRIAWGKFFKDNKKIKLPLSVQAHHSLIDGIHIAEYFGKFENYCADIKNYF